MMVALNNDVHGSIHTARLWCCVLVGLRCDKVRAFGVVGITLRFEHVMYIACT